MSEDRHVADRVREGLAKRRMSRLQLAEAARLSLSTLEKGLSGERHFTMATLVRLEEVLGVRLRAADPGLTHVQAATDLGGYHKEGVNWLVGTYLTLRPGFERADAVYAYLIRIAWDDDLRHLAFSESDRADARFAQRGVVSMPYQSGHIYLVTNEHGQFRTLTLGRPSIGGDMHGLITTLRVGRGGRLTPVSAPVALLRRTEQQVVEAALGQVLREQRGFDQYRDEIDRVLAEEFGLLIR